MKTQKNIKVSKVNLDAVFNLNDSQNLAFEEMVINSDAMKVVRQLMKDSDMTRVQFAEKLDVTEAYISKLFSSDKYFNVKLLAKIQRIFKMRFKVVTSDMIKQYKLEGVNTDCGNNIGPDNLSVNKNGIIQLIPQNVKNQFSGKTDPIEIINMNGEQYLQNLSISNS